jgi:hypothetical protein
MGFLLLGGPGETGATVEQSLVFTDSLKLDSLKISAGARIYPDTPLAKQAIEKGMVASPRELLFPRFYLEEGLGDWLRDTLKQWASMRHHWIIPEAVARKYGDDLTLIF